MSYLGTGISRLTEQIYVAQDEVRAARRSVKAVVKASNEGFGNAEQMANAVSALNHHASFTAGLVKAWEIVTGEIWGQAAWQPASTTRS